MPRRTKRGKDDVEEMLATLQREAAKNIGEVEDEENYELPDESSFNRMQRDDMFDENYFN